MCLKTEGEREREQYTRISLSLSLSLYLSISVPQQTIGNRQSILIEDGIYAVQDRKRERGGQDSKKSYAKASPGVLRL